MARSVTLTWDDDDSAIEFRRLAADRQASGYLTDADGDYLLALCASAEVGDKEPGREAAA